MCYHYTSGEWINSIYIFLGFRSMASAQIHLQVKEYFPTPPVLRTKLVNMRIRVCTLGQCCQRKIVHHRPLVPRQLQFCGEHKTGVIPTKSKSYRQILQKCFFLGLFGLQSVGFLLSNNYQEKSQFFRILFRIEYCQK